MTDAVVTQPQPIPMCLWCPMCGARHIDEGEFATKPHHTHSCQRCGLTWRPAIVPTCGVLFLPGFKSEVTTVDPNKIVSICRSCGAQFTARKTPDEWQCRCGGLVVDIDSAGAPQP